MDGNCSEIFGEKCVTHPKEKGFGGLISAGREEEFNSRRRLLQSSHFYYKLFQLGQ